jgi:hypothetical protein
MKKIITTLIVAFLLIFINFNIGIILTADSSFSFTKEIYPKIENKPAKNFILQIIEWILKLLGLYDQDDDGSDDNDDNGDDPEPSQPVLYTKDYDIFTNKFGDELVRFHGVLEKTGTAGTGISNLEFCWTWFEYKINDTIYETEPLMCRGDNLPRTFMYSIYIEERIDSPEIPEGIHYFRACGRNAAKISFYSEWLQFQVQ